MSERWSDRPQRETFTVRLLGLGSNVFGTSSPFKSCLNRAITFATSVKYR